LFSCLVHGPLSLSPGGRPVPYQANEPSPGPIPGRDIPRIRSTSKDDTALEVSTNWFLCPVELHVMLRHRMKLNGGRQVRSLLRGGTYLPVPTGRIKKTGCHLDHHNSHYRLRCAPHSGAVRIPPPLRGPGANLPAVVRQGRRLDVAGLLPPTRRERASFVAKW
jgi:hypothetical protein